MKKKVMVVLAAIVAAGVLAGCQGNTRSSTPETGTAPAETTAATEADPASAETTDTAAETSEESKAVTDVAGDAEILVAAAASLKNAYEDKLIPMFEEQNPWITVKGTYDSSGKLQTQIEEGLEADIFMSAAEKQMKALDEGGMIASETIVDLLENKIVLIVPAGSEAGFSQFEDIAGAEMIAIGDPASVPAGQYAEEALTSLGLWEGIQDKVSLGTNVTEVLNQVAAASADAGIVYATDAAGMADQVTVVAEAPVGSLATKVIYPAAVVKNSANAEAAGLFLEFLQSPEALAVFESYGFSAGQ